MQDPDKFRFELSRQISKVVAPDKPPTREEYVLRMAAVCDVAAMIWLKLQNTIPVQPGVIEGLSQAAADGMTKWANENLGTTTTPPN